MFQIQVVRCGLPLNFLFLGTYGSFQIVDDDDDYSALVLVGTWHYGRGGRVGLGKCEEEEGVILMSLEYLLKERNVEMHNAMLSSGIFPRRRADLKIFQQPTPLPGDLLSGGSLLASPSPSAIEAARFLSGRALDSFKE
ncbi:hypothetical protein Ahy_B05g079737 isoform B [Arachis hypogaea]|uniref:Uncharacterized protein n=1 Tax=Arachis hypogaea TaxID=3818 RepID=A0A444ZAR9_ARAHY|nr:hypothetical protein Ahy_B05g079737 isoform B [Arachis hypogaea]